MNGISFADGKKFVAAAQQTTAAGVLYSSAVVGKKQTVSVATKTDIVACKCIPTSEARELTQDKSTSTLAADQSTSTSSNVNSTGQVVKNSGQAVKNLTTNSRPNTTTQARKISVSQEKQSKPQLDRKHSLSPVSSRGKQTNLPKTNIVKETDRSRKGSEDPIQLYNRHQNIEDMEGDYSDGESQGGKLPFKPNQIKPPS